MKSVVEFVQLNKVVDLHDLALDFEVNKSKLLCGASASAVEHTSYISHFTNN